MEQELQIVKLLLKHGAKPNDQDATHGNTPLHLVVSVSQNTIALELLCRHHADPDIPNASGKTALDLTRMRRDCSATVAAEKWYTFAERRMANTLQKRHYQPQELEAFLAEEEGQLQQKRR